MAKQKLELTWIGKDQRPKLEPRILLEDPGMSLNKVFSENQPYYLLWRKQFRLGNQKFSRNHGRADKYGRLKAFY